MAEERPTRIAPSTPSPRPRVGLLLLLSAALTACSQQASAPVDASVANQLEAEQGTIQAFTTPQTVADPRNGGRIINDPQASGGRAVILLGTNDNVRFVVPGSVKAGRYTVSVVGRGEEFRGWPTVDLNNAAQKRLAVATLDSATYVTRKFGEFELKPGQVLNLSFINDLYEGRGKDRNAIVDYLVIEPAQTTPPPPVNQPPTVTLKVDNGNLGPSASPSPYADSRQYFEVDHNVTLEAAASDPDGKVARVEFYLGSTKLGEDTTAPYSLVLSNERFIDDAPRGSTFLARVVDDRGATADSNPANVVENNSSFRSPNLRGLDFGGTASYLNFTVFEPGSVGGFTTNGTPERLDPGLPLVPPVKDPAREALIRSSISRQGPLELNVPTPNGPYAVYLWVRAEDATPYTIRMEGQDVSRFEPGEAGRWDRLGPFAVTVRDGALNVASDGAARAHFSAIEYARLPQAGDVAPTVAFNPEPGIGRPPVDGRLTVNASDADGRVVKVEFYTRGAFDPRAPLSKIGEVTRAPYSVVWQNAPEGIQEVTAVATDDTGVKGFATVTTSPPQNTAP